MLIISSREFRQNQKMYLDLIDNDEQVVVQRGKDKAYRIVPVSSDDSIMTKEEFYNKIDLSLTQADEGNVKELTQEYQSELLNF